MNIKEALEKLNNGEYIRRKGWPDMLHLRLITNDETKVNKVECFEQITIPFIYDFSILESTDWRLFNDDNIITFLEAMEHFKKGERIQSKDWNNDVFIVCDRDKTTIFMKQMRVKNWMPLLSCLLANDWETLTW